MTASFFKNEELLEEKVTDDDYLSIDNSISVLSEKITASNKHLVLGVIGEYGIGKSTLISNVRKNRKDEDEDWIHFDAWQFPDRKELWDGLVIETAKHLNKLDSIKRKLEGESGKDKKLATNTLVAGADVVTTAFGLPQMLKPLFGLIKNLEYFADKSPARRVYEIQDIFKDLLNAIPKSRVVFVLEDTDRSGEAGLFFLETFRQFLNNTKLDKQVVCLVAVANKSYYQNIDSYLKCLDHIEFFEKKNWVEFDRFVEQILDSEDAQERKTLSEFLTFFYNTQPDINMRKIKLILRQASLNYKELSRAGYEPNKFICIAAEAAKYIFPNNNLPNRSLFDNIKSERQIPEGSVINRMVLIAAGDFKTYSNVYIFSNNGKEKILEHTTVISLIKRPSTNDIQRYPSTPYNCDLNYSRTNKRGVCLPDFYFNNL